MKFFAPKYRRQVIYGKIKSDVAEILSTLCRRKEIQIIKAEGCKNHVHMLVRTAKSSAHDFMTTFWVRVLFVLFTDSFVITFFPIQEFHITG